MSFALTRRDHDRMRGVHPDLVRVIERAAATRGCPPFMVVEGVRTVERQAELVRNGVSWTMNSRHIPAPNGHAHAIDIAPLVDNAVSWAWPHYYPLAECIKRAAQVERVPVEWGGDWRNHKDGPHWQLPWRQYPGGAAAVASAPPATDETEAEALVKSRTVAGSVLAGAGTGGTAASDTLGEIAGQVAPIAHVSSALTLIFVAFTLAGIGLVLYARWDDAGRPLPWRRRAPA